MDDLYQKAVERLQSSGGRITPQRRLILKTLGDLGGCDHPTAEELYGIVNQQDPSLHLSTIYRTLRWLQEEGFVFPRLFEEDPRQKRFDTVLPSEHYHFQCSSCKRVIEFKNPLAGKIKKQFEEKFKARVDTTSYMLYGLCADCQN